MERSYSPWDSSGKNTGVVSHSLLQGIFLTQRSNLGLLHCKHLPFELPGWGALFWLKSSYFISQLYIHVLAVFVCVLSCISQICWALTILVATPVRGQGRQPGGATPRPRSSGCPGAGGPRGAIPCSRSGGAVVRRYPLSKVRSSGCTLLEQPWRDNPRPR